jgi:hypothetical protein
MLDCDWSSDVCSSDLGGRGASAGPSWLAGPGVARLAAAPRFAPLAPPELIGEDVLLRLRPVW